jgi:hypothetical protein
MHVRILAFLNIVLIASTTLAQEPQKSPPAPPAPNAGMPTRAQLEKAFAEKMSNATLAGHFTDRTRKDAPLKEEKYTLGKVSKLRDDYWRFEARIQYGEHDVTLPLSLRVVWAGDTPVITLDKVLIPGFGTFTCRVMFFADQYAGTWDGGNHGGHLFGKVVPAKEADAGGAKKENSKRTNDERDSNKK